MADRRRFGAGCGVPFFSGLALAGATRVAAPRRGVRRRAAAAAAALAALAALACLASVVFGIVVLTSK